MMRLPFKVSVVRQTSSGGDHIVKYDGVLDLTDEMGPVCVEMISYYPATADPKLIQSAIESVQRGTAKALVGKGGTLRLYNFAIHPTDFRPGKCEEYTCDAIRSAIAPS